MRCRCPCPCGWSAPAGPRLCAPAPLTRPRAALVVGRPASRSAHPPAGARCAPRLPPLPVYRQVQLLEFPANAFGDLIVGVSLFAAAVFAVDLHWTPLRVAYIVAALVGGTLMEGAVHTALSALHIKRPAAMLWTYWTE